LTIEQFSQYTGNDGQPKIGPKTRIGYLLTYAGQLKLTKVQIDSLTNDALLLVQLKADYKNVHPDMEFDSQTYELLHITNVLTPAQYDAYFVIKNTATAKTWAMGDWAEIGKRGLNNRLDSATTVASIINYYSNLLAVREKNKKDPEKLNAGVKNIVVPEIIKQLKASKKYNNPTGTNASTVKAGYAW
jgi:hypothetical protein